MPDRATNWPLPLELPVVTSGYSLRVQEPQPFAQCAGGRVLCTSLTVFGCFGRPFGFGLAMPLVHRDGTFSGASLVSPILAGDVFSSFVSLLICFPVE